MSKYSKEIEAFSSQFPEVFLYLSCPGDGQHRYVFQNHVAIGHAEALAYMLRKCLEHINPGAMDR